MSKNLGALEEIILLLVLKQGESYGAELVKLYQEQMKKGITLPAIVMVLKRLEKKGFLESRMGEPTSERGGRSKVLYKATPSAYLTVADSMNAKNAIWNSVPKPI
ncbi:PadR family transcriptional regulator [Ekhidna sp. To15]|uniref:PadR family transcriptional regulator n=1 Tax=Ekhidna sp. To15 TaxID=3395267 RepID=UPI003F526B52